LSGHEVGPTGAIDYARTYLGGLSCPVFLLQGANRGLAILDDNRADFGADEGACVRRTYVLANTFPPDLNTELAPSSGGDGPFVGVCHSRAFRGQSEVGLSDADMNAELRGRAMPMEMRGDAVDLGPVRAFAYQGDWKSGAAWLREQRQHVRMRRVPDWFAQTTILSEDLGDGMVKRGQSFHDYPQVLADKERLGANVFHLPGFSEAEIIGQSNNWQNRGDYLSAAHNLGGPEAARAGIEAVHRRGGRVLYYVEGLIMWKRSRIGKSRGREWALMKADGSYDEHYEGFWHMCPACNEWGDWLGQTCADIVQSTGVDGFFIDSTAATHFHRCFNPAHKHPHPDVWNWGIRNLLRCVRQAVDRVNPQTVLLVEGAADLAREFVDGSLAHSSDWLKGDFKVPLARFVHADLNVFESWGYAPGEMGRRGDNNEALHLFNAVHGHRIYAHDPLRDRMASLSLHTRRVYDAFREVCEHPISVLSPRAENCIAQLFDGMPRVLTVANIDAFAVAARLELPFDAGVLFNRMNGHRVPVRGRRAELPLQPFELCAFEVRA